MARTVEAMPRSPRLVEPGGFYHVTPRGNDGRAIFDDTDEVDRRRHLALLERTARKHGWTVLAYCLMTNHVHLLVQVLDQSLSAGMQELLGEYARFWNSRHGRTGHLFRNRFSCAAVESDRHLREAARYVDLNPIRAQLASRPEHWQWSSYRALVGLDHAPPFLATSALLELFGPTPAKARIAYRRFVQEGHAWDGRVQVSDT
jgi:REP element-mobilizing transposase RayT